MSNEKTYLELSPERPEDSGAVARQIDSLREAATLGELGHELLDEVAGGTGMVHSSTPTHSQTTIPSGSGSTET